MWKLAVGVVAVFLGLQAATNAEEKVELKGRLRTGVVAIGGETTGTIVETKDGPFELDISMNKELADKIAKLDGKQVVVTGILEIRKGEEIRERKIVVVKTLELSN
jgi:hypothetical protein